MTWPMYPALLLRRHLSEPWFKPIARIGSDRVDEYPLEPVDVSVTGDPQAILVAEIKARRTGGLFLFVNDAVLPLPRSWQWFFANNSGKAQVTVQPVTAAPL